MDQQYSSILLENAVNEFAKLPGIGRKTALRLVLHLLRQEEGEAEKFGNTIIKLCKEIKHCHICHNISDSDTCTICVESLVNRVASGGIKEVILALSATMEGDTTNFYIFRKLAPFDVKITIIARGVSIGGELEYTDEITLGRSILNRTLFSESFKG